MQNPSKFNRSIHLIEEELNHTKEDFINHFKETYKGDKTKRIKVE